MNRVAVVTGVSRRQGLGFAIARRLAADGVSILAQGWPGADDDPGDMDELAEELRASGADVETCTADFADPTAPAAVMTTAARAFGHVDSLVANHALSRLGALDELTADDVDAHLHVNVRATLLLVKEYAAQHDGRPGGRVVLLTSGQHIAPMTTEVAYAASKGALQQVTATFADALIDRGITVNAVNPGPTDTGWAAGLDASRFPLGRWGQPDDAARLIAWLCSDEGEWITGQVIDSEGGFRRWG